MNPAFEKIQARYAQELSGFSAAAVEEHPAGDPARWNARQVVEHLILTYRISGGVFQDRLEKQRPTKGRPTPRQRLGKFVLLGLGHFPRGLPAPANVTPVGIDQVVDGAGLASLFNAELGRIDELLGQCQQCFGSQEFASHPAFGPLSVSEWRRFHVLHARHHIGQIKRIKPLLTVD